MDRQRRREVFPSAQSAMVRTFADLPTAEATKVGWIAFVSNGRKSGEGVGSGSGVLAYCAETGSGTGVYRWFRFSDDTQVAT
jgi:hypothetical protein